MLRDMYNPLQIQSLLSYQDLDVGSAEYHKCISDGEHNSKNFHDMPLCERLLPDDILFEVFLLCVPGNTDPEFNGKASISAPLDRWSLASAPWYLGRICSRWRSVLLSSPSLWATIEISVLHGRPRSYEMLDAFLERSQDTPLHVHWGWLRPSNYYRPTLFSPVEGHTMFSHLLRKSCHRWREFSFSDASGLWYDPTDFRATFPILQSLSLPTAMTYDNSEEASQAFENPHHLIQCLATMSALSSLRIRSTGTAFLTRPWFINSLYPLLPMEQLTTLDTPSFLGQPLLLSAQDAITVLCKLPNLVHCKLGVSAIDFLDHAEDFSVVDLDDPSSSPRIASRPSLQSLDLLSTKSHEIGRVLSRFSFPHLTSLSVLFMEMTPALNFVTRTSLYLTSLSITWHNTRALYVLHDGLPEPVVLDTFSRFLQEQTSLKHVSFNFGECYTNALSDIMGHKDIYNILQLFVCTPTRAVCPNLQTLSTTWSRKILHEHPWLSKDMTELVLCIAETRDLPTRSSSTVDHDTLCSTSPLQRLEILLSITKSNSKKMFADQVLPLISRRIRSTDCARTFFDRRRKLKRVLIDVALSVDVKFHSGGRAVMTKDYATL